MRIVLDTNAFYAYFGEKNLNILTPNQKIDRDKFNDLISSPNNEIVISTVTIYEFLVKFRDDIQIIRNGLLFIKNNIGKIYIDPIMPFEVDDFRKLLAMSDSNLSSTINNYLEKKIDIEASYSSYFLGLLVAQCTDMFLKTDTNFQTSQVLMTYLQCVPNNIMATKEVFVLALRDGYNLHDEEKVVKDRFNEIIYEFLSSWLSFLELVKIHPSSELTDIELHNLFEKIKSENHILKKIHRIQREKNNLSEWITRYIHSSLEPSDFVKALRCALKKRGVNEIQIKYMDWILAKMVNKGAKFSKNDILDMLIAFVLKDSDIVLISFDEDMQDFIENIKHVSLNYINQVYSR